MRTSTCYYDAGQARIVVEKNAEMPVWLYLDHLGSATVAANSGGIEVTGSRASYLPYGQTRQGGTTLPTDRRFTGQLLDNYINLYWIGSRWYDPSLGRWIQPDTIVPDPGNPQDLNRYSYCRNNPLAYVDKDGHFPFLILGVVFIAAGVGAGINEYHQVASYAEAHGMTWWSAFASKDLNLDQGSMVNSAVKWGLTAGAAAEGGPALAGGVGLATQQAGLWLNDAQVFGTGTQLLNGAARANAILSGANGLGLGKSQASQMSGPASVDELMEMINQRSGVHAEYAEGDQLRYMRTIGVDGTHFQTESGTTIYIDKDIATRRTVLHEWIHHILRQQYPEMQPGEDAFIEQWLDQHKNTLETP